MNTTYQDFVASRIFIRNDYGSTEALLEAIEAARQMPDSQWRDKKHAFNCIGEKAPMRDGAFCLVLAEVPDAIAAEVRAYENWRHSEGGQ